VRRLAKDRDCDFEWKKHALVEMADGKPFPATAPDVVYCLTNGQVILEEYKEDILWRVKGRDLDGRTLQVIIAAYESEKRIKIVTVF
jgi:hypothetical protein